MKRLSPKPFLYLCCGLLLLCGCSGQKSSTYAYSYKLPPPPEMSGYLFVSNKITPPERIKSEQERLSDLMILNMGKAVVKLEIGIGISGNVEVGYIKVSQGKNFDKIALDEVKNWKYKPAMKNGVPVPVRILVEKEIQFL